jgi:hypothetical protein
MTVMLWNKTQAKMLPTPAKFHYLFNMRELSKVFQGVMLATRDRCAAGCQAGLDSAFCIPCAALVMRTERYCGQCMLQQRRKLPPYARQLLIFGA